MRVVRGTPRLECQITKDVFFSGNLGLKIWDDEFLWNALVASGFYGKLVGIF